MTRTGRSVERRRVLQGICGLICASGVWTQSGRGNQNGSGDNGGDWTQYQRNAGNTGYTSDIQGPSSNAEILWEFDAGSEVYAPPAIVGDMVYTVSAEGTLYAVRDGRAEWQFGLAEASSTTPHLSSPAVSNGKVYIGDMNGSVYAISDGEEEWRRGVGGEIRSSPTLQTGTVYFGSTDGNVYALDAATSEREWVFETDGEISGTPAIENGILYVGLSSSPFGEDTFYGIDVNNGEVQWSTETQGDISDAAAADSGVVYFADNSGVIYAIDGDSGTHIWEHDSDHSKSSQSSISVSENIVCAVLGDFVYAVERETGEFA